MNSATTPIVKMDNTAPDLLAAEIVAVSQAAKKLLDSRLSKRALLVLLHDSSKQPMVVIERVLNAAADLSKDYVKR